MTDYPMTPEQEQELRERARRFYRNQPAASPEVAAIVLSAFVFEGGRLASSVSLQTRLRIASEEKT